MSSPSEPVDPADSHLELFRQTIDDCFGLYRSSAESSGEPLPVMDDLARGLLIKMFLAVVQADRRFSKAERQLAQELIFRLWNRMFSDKEIGPVLQDLIPMADKFKWYQLVRPFEIFRALHDRVADVETIVVRFTNLVAKADGTIAPSEAAQLDTLLAEINRHLKPVPIDSEEAAEEQAADCDTITSAFKTMQADGAESAAASSSANARAQDTSPPDKEQRLEKALKSLDDLIGLGEIKKEIHELTRFLRVQQHREEAGLPRTQVSLHCVFAGNPGTGKTTVARVLGEIYGALGIVKSGHLVETDRSGLVAGYMGQTAPRASKLIDRALDGVLFIDEAYSLVNEHGDDPYGHEALQVLLKRMEDDRDRLVVVLAGYSGEMARLLQSNPGLESRFQRTFHFPDYSPVELCRIFKIFCDKNHYLLPGETRARMLLGFEFLAKQRDEHFGNARLVRNAFELAIRRLASRIVDQAPLTKDLLTRLEPADVMLPGVPEAAVNAESIGKLFVTIVCPSCEQASALQAVHLGRRAKCNKCDHKFTADWGEPGGASPQATS